LIDKRNPQLKLQERRFETGGHFNAHAFFLHLFCVSGISYFPIFILFFCRELSPSPPPQFKTELSGFFQLETLNIETLNLGIPLLCPRVRLNFSKNNDLLT
jgi:hypothetical protein